MRKLLLISLLAPLLNLVLPLEIVRAETDGEIDLMCSFSTKFSIGDLSEEEGLKAAEEWEQSYDESLTINADKSRCGVTPHPNTGYLEKSDCTAGGYVVTEITEVLAPDVPALESGDKVVTVYGGLCCLIKETDDDGEFVECKDERTVYTTSYSDCNKGLIECKKRQWVIGTSGVGIVKVVVKQIYTWGAFTVGSIAVVTIIIQGIRISASGVSGDITEAKNKILQAIAGLVLLFLSGLILYTINPEFFGG